MTDGLRQLNDHIWIFPHDPDETRVQPTVGMVLTKTQTILIDSGHSPRHARRALSLLRDIGAPTITHVIYTHHHWDHTFGGMMWGNAAFVAHEQCRELMRAQYSSKPWSSMYIQEEIRVNPTRKNSLRAMDRAIDDWRNFRLALPTITFAKELDIYLDGLTLEMRHVGGQHAPDSITIRVRESRVMFIGDCYYGNEGGNDVEMVKALLDEDVDLYIEGHSDPRTRVDMAALMTQTPST